MEAGSGSYRRVEADSGSTQHVNIVLWVQLVERVVHNYLVHNQVSNLRLLHTY